MQTVQHLQNTVFQKAFTDSFCLLYKSIIFQILALKER